MGIIKQYHADTDTTYVYESESYWDHEKKQSRSRRRLIGKVDKETGEVVPTGKRGRKKKTPPEEGTDQKAGKPKDITKAATVSDEGTKGIKGRSRKEGREVKPGVMNDPVGTSEKSPMQEWDDKIGQMEKQIQELRSRVSILEKENAKLLKDKENADRVVLENRKLSAKLEKIKRSAFSLAELIENL